MIVNESVLSREDNEFLLKCIIAKLIKSPRKIFWRIVLLLLSAGMLVLAALCLWLIVKAPKYHIHVGAGIYCECIIFGIIGTIGLLSVIFGRQVMFLRTVRSEEWKRVNGNAVRTVIDGDTLTTFRSADGTDIQSRYAISLLEGFCEHNGALYLWLSADGMKKFIVLRDNGYCEGSKAELLALLHQRGIPVCESP